MGYNINSAPRAGTFANTIDITVQAPNTSGAATVNSPALELGDMRVARLKLDVTAVGGTPTLDVTVQISKDGQTWYTSGTFAHKTGVSNELKAFLLDRFVRVSAVIAVTTPSVTYSVKGEAA